MGEKINSQNAAEYGRMGGRKSGEKRREKRTMRETLETLLSMSLTNGKTENLEKIKGFKNITKDSNIPVGDKIAVNLVKKAMAGDLQAVAMIRDQIGEKPKEEIETTIIQVPKFEGEDEIPD